VEKEDAGDGAMRVFLWRPALAVLAAAGFLTAEPGRAEHPSTLVHLQPFYVPVVKEGARAGYAPLTVYLEVPTKEQAANLCRYSPRLRETFLLVFEQDPVRMDRANRIDLGGLDEKLLGHANAAFGEPVVGSIHVVAAAHAIATGTAAKFPAATIFNCRFGGDGEPEKKERKK
jgi:hypothetical protein